MRRRLRVATFSVVAAMVLGLASSGSAADAATSTTTPENIWGVQVGPKTVRLLNERTLLRLSQGGVNSLILRTGMNARQIQKVRAVGKRWSFEVISPLAEPPLRKATTGSTADALAAKCLQAKQEGTISYCAVRARSLQSALGLSSQQGVDLVLVPVRGPGQLAKLPVSGSTSRIVAVTPLRGGRGYRGRAWRDAVRLANGTSSLDLAVAPTGGSRTSALTSFTSTLKRGLLAGMFPPDAVPPGAPVLGAARATETALTFAWERPRSQSTPLVYVLYRDGAYVATTAYTSATYTGLRCGSRHRIALEAVGRGGVRSLQSTLDVATAACSAGGAGPASTAPPPPPGGGSSGSPSPPSAGSGGSTGSGGQGGSTLPVTPPTPSSPGIPASTPVSPPPATQPPASPPVTPPSATPPTAPVTGDVWVAGNGSDANPCTQVAPCLSFGRAYQAAVSGQTVVVAGGSYPYQRLVFDPRKSSAHVVFRPAAGASVSVAQIDFGQAQLTVPAAQHVTIRDMSVGYLRAWDGTADVEWRNITGRTFEILSSSGSPYPPSTNVSVIGGSFGPCQAPRDQGCTTKLIGSNLVVDGATIFGSTSSDLANYHADGMFIRGCRDCAVRRTKFRGNMVTHIRIQDCCGLPASQNVVLENNWFSAPVDRDGSSPRGDAIDVDNPIPTLLIRNNSFAENTGVVFGNGNFSGTRLVGNLMMNFPCVAGVSYSYNLFIPLNPTGWGTTPCSPTDRRVTSFGYVSTGGFDYHLAPGSPASGSGSPGDCPATDIDGQGRPTPCSAGSDER